MVKPNQRIQMENRHDTSSIKAQLSAIVSLPAAQLDLFLSKLTVKEVSKGQLLIQQGAIADSLYFVNKGLFRTYLISNGNEINTEFFFENSFMSAFTSFLLHKPTSLNIEALKDASLLVISKNTLEDMYAVSPLWFAIGKHIFENEFVKKCRRESSFLQQNATERYLTLLQQYPLLEASVSLSHIASYLGIKPETLSRIRAGKYQELTYIKDT